MAIGTAQQYLERVRKRKPAVYLGGKKIDDLLANPVTKSAVDALARVYAMTQEEEHKAVMTANSHLTGETISRNLHVSRSIDDLDKRQAMALLTSQKLGTCNYRCVGCDALSGVASTAWEVDKEKGTSYYQRLMDYLGYLQREDLALSGAMTESKGDRSKRPGEQDPDSYVRVVERRKDGIVVRGAKQHQSGAHVVDETLVIPALSTVKGEEEYALAFAVPNGARGLTYIVQYNAYSAERELEADTRYLGTPIYGQRETCLMVFDDVFVPWERVFLCGEVDHTRRLIHRFARMHRMNCGGACKVGFADLIIGAARLIAEYLGIERAPHVVAKMTRMVALREISQACALAAAFKGGEEPLGSGIWLPNEVYGNAAKLNTADAFWEIMKLAGDIAGGASVTIPHERDLENPETRAYVEKYLKSKVSAAERLRMTRFLQNWIAGLHGPGTWHGAGPVEAQMITLNRDTDWESKKQMARELAGLKGG